TGCGGDSYHQTSTCRPTASPATSTSAVASRLADQPVIRFARLPKPPSPGALADAALESGEGEAMCNLTRATACLSMPRTPPESGSFAGDPRFAVAGRGASSFAARQAAARTSA